MSGDVGPRRGLVELGYRRVLRPALFRAYGGDPERVHEQTLRALRGAVRLLPGRAALAALGDRPYAPVRVAGVDFPNRVGLAAGMDKDGVALGAWGRLGFGHVELGTVTADAQPGNDRPRLFRLPASGALVNRMGFNNHGAQALADRLAAAGVARGNGAAGLVVGISLGKTKTTPLAEAAEDYLSSLRRLAGHADYLAVNVSSPNTPGLRRLQEADTLRSLLDALLAEARRIAQPVPPVPIFVKVAPDLSPDALEELVGVVADTGAAGLIATNTTLGRGGVAAADRATAAEVGGLSGAPLAARAREVVRFLTTRTTLPVIGVGGILTAADGQAMLDAGAVLLQVYTGFVYGGPGLVSALGALGPAAVTA